MAEMRLSSVIVGGVIVGAIGLVGAALMDWVNLPVFNKKTLLGWMDQGAAQVTGFTPAKTPQEAMDKFREAIDARKYKTAATYCTKSYADMLERSADGAAELGGAIDRVRDYAKNKGTDTDKVRFLFHLLDPFPKNLRSGPPPVPKGDKYYGKYELEVTNLTTSQEKLWGELRSMDINMFKHVLAPKQVFANPIEIIKDGEHWKLNIPTNPVWDLEVAYFNDNWRAYFSALSDFKGWMMNNNPQISTAQGMETEVIEILRKSKKNN